MTITIHSTSHITQIEVNGQSVPARVWEGETESGTRYITRIAPTISPSDVRNDEFAAQLKECEPPTVPGIPLRMIL